MTEKEIDKEMEKIPEGHRYRWCEVRICFCMGCVNRANKRKLTKQEWENWVDRQGKNSGQQE